MDRQEKLDTGAGEVPNHAYVIDSNFHLISLDEEAKKLFPNAKIGDCCFAALRASSHACNDCP